MRILRARERVGARRAGRGGLALLSSRVRRIRRIVGEGSSTNKVPSAPEISIRPGRPDTQSDLTVVIDEPDSTSDWGGAKECDEDDNAVDVDLSEFCP